MTIKVSKYIFRLLNQETALLISRFPEDETIINDLYENMINTEADDLTIYRNYVTVLIKYCESKEYYEKCAMLLKIKEKLTF